MASINSSNYYSAANGTSGNGLSGLASGMDTEAMVEKMLSGTQNKINKQEALKQQETWRQEIYRDMITNINSFSSKYFDSKYGASTKNNFASAGFFNSMLSAVSKGDAVRVIGAGSSANTGDIRVAVKSLATNAKMNSDKKMSTGKTVKGTEVSIESFDKALAKNVTIKADGKEINVDLSKVTTESEMAEAFNKAFTDNGVKATAKIAKGALQFATGDATTKIEVDAEKSSDLGKKMTGFSRFAGVDVKDKDGNVTGVQYQGDSINMSVDPTITLSLDGIEKTISIKGAIDPATGKVTAESVKKSIEGEINRAFGSYAQVNMVGDDAKGYSFEFKFSLNEPGHELKVTGENLGILGIKPGASTAVNNSTTLNELGATGDKFKFSINGKEFSFSGNETIGSVMNAINSSGSGVKISYSSISDTFKMESTSTGAGYNIDIKQTEGDFLSTMFGDKINASGSVTSKGFTTGSISGAVIPDDFTAEEMSMDIMVNGVKRTFTIPKEKDKTYDKAEITTKLNEWLKDSYGTYTDANGNKVQNIEYKADGKLAVAKGFEVSFAATDIDVNDPGVVDKAKETDLGLLLGFNKTATSNKVTADTRISEISDLAGGNFKKADGSQATTFGEIDTIDGIKVKIEADGKINISGNADVDISGSSVLKTIFGKDKLVFSDGAMDPTSVAKGTDAVVIVNGEETTRSSNTIVVDGVSMELTKVSAETAAGSGIYEETVISTTRDSDSIVDGFKAFVEDYNKMVDKLLGYTSSEATYKKYAPLTTEQKKEMGENEIKLWEENAKKGLVRRDSTVEQFLSEMRIAVYSKPTGSTLALYNIGIETTSSYNDGGKLKFDEAALRKALSDDPEAVKNLFTNSVDGIAKTMTKAMDRTAKESSGTPGTLVQLAGTSTVFTKKNTIYDRIANLENRISDLKVKYNKEKQRYWNQFSNMESILSNYNQQSQMLSNQMGGY